MDYMMFEGEPQPGAPGAPGDNSEQTEDVIQSEDRGGNAKQSKMLCDYGVSGKLDVALTDEYTSCGKKKDKKTLPISYDFSYLNDDNCFPQLEDDDMTCEQVCRKLNEIKNREAEKLRKRVALYLKKKGVPSVVKPFSSGKKKTKTTKKKKSVKRSSRRSCRSGTCY